MSGIRPGSGPDIFLHGHCIQVGYSRGCRPPRAAVLDSLCHDGALHTGRPLALRKRAPTYTTTSVAGGKRPTTAQQSPDPPTAGAAKSRAPRRPRARPTSPSRRVRGSAGGTPAAADLASAAGGGVAVGAGANHVIMLGGLHYCSCRCPFTTPESQNRLRCH
jgi:hypothetical protein